MLALLIVIKKNIYILLLEEGIEPSRYKTLEPKSNTSTNSVTQAHYLLVKK